MSFEGVIVTPGEGGLNRTNGSTDAVMALVVHTPTKPADVDYNVGYRIIDVKQAEDLGFNASFDANNNVLVHDHISEFFRLAPEGTLVVIPTDLTKASTYFVTAHAKALFRAVTDVKRIGFVFNHDTATTLTDEINAAQAFRNELFTDKIYLDGIYLEGRNLSKAAATLRALTAGNVSVVATQDPGVASLDAAYAKYAAVGSALGMRAARKVNENLGSVDIVKKPALKRGAISYPLTDTTLGKWLSANLSNGTPISSLTIAEQKQLTAFGYIFAGSFQGFAGVFFNGEPTCIALSSDYSTGENNGVWNKAALGIRNALLPKVRGWFQRDGATGNLKSTDITNLENIGKKPLQAMQIANEISDFDFQIPANQNPNDQTPLQCKVSITLGAIIHTFDVDLSLV